MISDELDTALRDAAAVIDGIPADRFYPDLKDYMDFKTRHGGLHCGTLACAAGWIELHEDPTLALGCARVVELCGVPELSKLFNLRTQSPYDHNAPTGISDKDLFRWRVICFLREHGRPVSAAYARGW